MSLILRSQKLFSVLGKVSRGTVIYHFKDLKNVQTLLHAAPKSEVMMKEKESLISQCLMTVKNKIQRAGLITQRELENILKAVENMEHASSAQILLLIKSCGSVANTEKQEVRMECINKIWKQAEATGMKFEVGHFIAILRVYIENEWPISHVEFLNKMEKMNVKPNRVIYQNLLACHCKQGNLISSTEVLEEMKKLSYPLNEIVFNSLIFGYCKAEDYTGAENVMKIMREKELEINNKTYGMYLCGLASSGNAQKVKEVYEECSRNGITFETRDMLDLIYYLAVGGNRTLAMEFLEMVEVQQLSEFIILINRLLHKNQHEMCLEVLSTLDESVGSRANFVLRHVALYEDTDTIKKFIKFFKEKGFQGDPISYVLYYMLTAKMWKKSLTLIDENHRSGEKVKIVYFWPLLAAAAEDNDINGILNIVKTMNNYGLNIGRDVMTDIILKNLNVPDATVKLLLHSLANIGLPRRMLFYSYFKACLAKMDYNNAEGVLTNCIFPRSINDITDNIIKCVTHGNKPSILVNVLYNWAVQQRISDTSNSATSKDSEEGSGSEESSDDSSTDIDQYIKKHIQDVVLTLSSKLDDLQAGVFQKTLSLMILKGLPLSESACDEIRGKWSDPEILELLNQMKDVEFDVSENKEHFSKGTLLYMKEKVNRFNEDFAHFCRNNQLDEAEKLLKEDPTVQTGKNYIMFIRKLKKMGDEEKITKYLNEYLEKFSQSEPLSVFIALELMDRRMYKQFFELLSQRGNIRPSERLILRNEFIKVLETDSLEIFNYFCDMRLGSIKIITFEDIFNNLKSSDKIDKTLEILRNAKISDLSSLKLKSTLLAYLYNTKNFKVMEEVIEIIKERFLNCNSVEELFCCYACLGNIKEGRELVAKHGDMKMNDAYFSKINNDEVGKVLKNAIEILKHSNIKGKEKLYERLVKVYELENVPVEKAIDLWEEMQEQDIEPTALFLQTLANYLNKNNVEVPFTVPGGIQDDQDFEFLPHHLRVTIEGLYRNQISQNIRGVLYDAWENNVLSIGNIKKTIDVLKAQKSSPTLLREFEIALDRISYRKAFINGNLADFITENHSIEELKSKGQVRLIGRLLYKGRNFGWCPTEVAKLAIWCYFINDPKNQVISKTHSADVAEILKNEEALHRFLKAVPHFREMNKIIQNFLNNVDFEGKQHIKSMAEQLLEKGYIASMDTATTSISGANETYNVDETTAESETAQDIKSEQQEADNRTEQVTSCV